MQTSRHARLQSVHAVQFLRESFVDRQAHEQKDEGPIEVVDWALLGFVKTSGFEVHQVNQVLNCTLEHSMRGVVGVG